MTATSQPTSPTTRRTALRVLARVLALAGLATAGLLPTAVVPAAANPPRVTRGDAQAVFQAFPTGGRAMINHSPASLGAPADLELRATIRPLADEGFDGRHYCASDWHVIVLADFFGGDRSFSRQRFEDVTANDEITFRLDGAVLPTTRTAIKRVNSPEQFGFAEAYVFQQGRVMSPDELAVGAHTLDATVVFPPDTFELHITFHLDAPGTGACV